MTRFMIATVFAGLIPAPAAWGVEATVPKFTAPRILEAPQDISVCRAEPVGALRNEFSVTLKIGADGKLNEFDLADESPEWVRSLADCAVAPLRFAPGTRNDVAVDSTASLTFRLRTSGSGDPAVVEIDSRGPLITPPLLRRTSSIDDCFSSRLAGSLSRFVITVTILPDGSVGQLTLPVGSEPWQQTATKCVLSRVVFTPGTANGVPVEAKATLPIVYKTDGGAVGVPKLRSSDDEIEAAYRACYPADLVTFASAYYRFEISTRGKVSNPKLVKGSGDPRLDDAGICILPKLEFTPLMQDGRAIRASITWELPMRPPR